MTTLELLIRPVTLADAGVLLDWRNDPVTRAMSKTTEPVSPAEHIAWLSTRLTRAEPNLFIVETDGRPSATFRIDGDEVSYTVAPEMRGKRLASHLLAKVRHRYGVLRAEIFEDNIASIRAARSAGMRIVILKRG